MLVNNVGDVSSEQMSWRDLTQEALDAVVDVDVKGTLLMTHEFGGRMLEQGHGNIINVGSTVIVRGSPRAPQYAAAKYAILGITKSYAKVLAPPCGSTRSRPASWRPSGSCSARTGRAAAARC